MPSDRHVSQVSFCQQKFLSPVTASLCLPPPLPAPTRCPDRFMHFLPERLDHYFFKINFKFYIQSTKNKNKSAQCGPKMCSFHCILHCMGQGTHALGQGCVQRGEKRGTTLCGFQLIFGPGGQAGSTLTSRGGGALRKEKETGSKRTAGKMVKMANEKSGCLGGGIGDATLARTPMPRDHFARCHFFSTDHPSPITTTALVRASVSCKFGLTTYVMVQSKHQK